MAAYVETKIAEALLARLAGMPGVPLVAWPNKDFTPPSSGQYLRVSIQPNRTETIEIGVDAWNRHRGIMQVDVMDRQDVGAIAAMETAGKVIARFNRNVAIEHEGLLVRMDAPPSIAGMLKTDNGWTQTPVTIRWWCDAPNPS